MKTSINANNSEFISCVKPVEVTRIKQQILFLLWPSNDGNPQGVP